MLTNDITEKWIQIYTSRPKAALLIDSPLDKDGGVSITKNIYEELIGSSSSPLVSISAKDGKSIGIDEVREIKRAFSLSANRDSKISRFAVIEDASKLTPEAQNSLLKLIEELPERTIIALVADNISEILQTIKSRCFYIPVVPIEKEKALKYAEKNGKDLLYANKIYNLSEGRASYFVRYLEDNEEVFSQVELAKKFFASSVFDRQAIVESLIKKEFDLQSFISTMKITAKAGMYGTQEEASRHRWKKILKKITNAETQLSQNSNTKLTLLSLSVNI